MLLSNGFHPQVPTGEKLQRQKSCSLAIVTHIVACLKDFICDPYFVYHGLQYYCQTNKKIQLRKCIQDKNSKWFHRSSTEGSSEPSLKETNISMRFTSIFAFQLCHPVLTDLMTSILHCFQIVPFLRYNNKVTASSHILYNCITIC